MYVADGLMHLPAISDVAAAAEAITQLLAFTGYRCVGCASVYDTTLATPGCGGCGGCKRSGWMEGVDRWDCCTAARRPVPRVAQHLQPIDMRAVSNEGAPLTRAERPDRSAIAS